MLSSLAPALRLALAALLVSALAAALGAGLHVAALRAAGEAASRDAVDGQAVLLAGTMAPHTVDRGTLIGAFQASVRAPAGRDQALALLDAEFRVVASTDPAATRGLPWRSAFASASTDRPSSALTVLPRGSERVLVALRPLGAGGYRAAALRPAYRLPMRSLLRTIAGVGTLWAVLATVLVLGGYLAGPRVTERLKTLGQRLAQPDAESGRLVTQAERELGPLASVFDPLGQRVQQLAGSVVGAREHVASLYQVNPHYVVLCTMDGHIVEANPAFYAITGLPPEALRGGRIEALAEVFPVETLMPLAERSLREGASIGGLEFALHDRDDQVRPVEVALRAFRQGEGALLVIQATDMSVRRSLERRVEAFSDTLDLMVDQRVQQLTSGQLSLRRLLDEAGVVVASFDRAGATRRWSGAAQQLSGRAAAQVPHFTVALGTIGLQPGDRAAFGRWYWGDDPAPFLAIHHAADGVERAILWRRVDADHSGATDHRTIIGVDVPADVGVVVTRALGISAGITGDGVAGDGLAGPGTVPAPPATRVAD